MYYDTDNVYGLRRVPVGYASIAKVTLVIESSSPSGK